ncbi:hypothetical protein JZ751_024804 [Albula glossodonta]|uniref:Uncharacterized protein n=1 Tax=Albula glossodonta TaxID=121402 RepID=A0A8T2PEF7_9TELE|nr:hypothetical protein JZ751_024804 [Albula glossodonta]
MKKTGTFTEVPYCKTRTSELERNLGPGRYDVDTGDFSARAVRERAKGPGWRRAQEMGWLARIPHVLYRETWEHKRFLKSKVGPGSYRIDDFIELLRKKPQSVRGVCESREERFKSFYAQSGTPGPGSYGKGGVPSALLDQKRMQLTGTCPTMDFGPRVERMLEAKREYGLGPGTYNLKSSTDLLLSRVISKRGPYETFSGRRDKPIPKRSSASSASLGMGEKSSYVSSFGEDLQRPEKRKHGVFSKLCRNPKCPTERIFHSTLAQCPRPVSLPGPGWYSSVPSLSGAVNRNPPPFLSSAPRISERTERLQNGNLNHCMLGPGTYKIAKTDKKTTLHSHHSAFKSRTQRYLHNPERDKLNQ